eukprot:TRINITY_DN47799_c0_g1_i1.p1 TRINITY_DN47799_c0_g1~~TRINITY_DN47799_c0_g1_i1.p1  ORF type:complete len:244 (+),score=68.73 TRINITY_DN47799_c0_g1_i1:76-732(+)
MDNKELAVFMSEMLSWAIVVGSASLKVPQMIKIVKAGSAAGVSELTTVLENYVFWTSFMYGYMQRIPVSAYMENGICGAQCVILWLLVMYYGKCFSASRAVLFGAIVAYCAAFVGGTFNFEVAGRPFYQYLYMSLNVASICSKGPQILLFHRMGHTGHAAFLTWFLGFGGSAARVLTTLIQVGDPLMVFSYVVNAALGGTIVLQFLYYWNARPKTKAE